MVVIGGDFGDMEDHVFYIIVDGEEMFRSYEDFDLDDFVLELPPGEHSVFLVLEKDELEVDEDGYAENTPHVDLEYFKLTGSTVGGAVECTPC